MARFDVEGLDEVIHGRLRLGIVAFLAHAEAADFNELKAALNATQGNLSIHLRKLEDVGYVAIDIARAAPPVDSGSRRLAAVTIAIIATTETGHSP